MPDITKCTNETCPLKEKCYRWTSKPNEFQQSYAEFEYEGWFNPETKTYLPTCAYFMEKEINE